VGTPYNMVNEPARELHSGFESERAKKNLIEYIFWCYRDQNRASVQKKVNRKKMVQGEEIKIAPPQGK
jgi:hypothetical protein